MSSSYPVPFGKRGDARRLPGAPPAFGPQALNPDALVAPDEDHAAFFAAVRAELAGAYDDRHMVVPRSFKAAFLAGLVVGCALIGFDVTGSAGSAEPSPFASIASALGAPLEAAPIDLAPVMMFFGLLKGARIAAMTIVAVHTLLRWADCSSHIAYAAGGAIVSFAVAAALLFGFGHPPAHGWVIELAAGAACGLLYRVFAGRVAAKP